MATLTLNRTKLQHNYTTLVDWLQVHDVHWGVVTKLLCGYEPYLQEVLKLGVTEVHDSRLSNLEIIKRLNPTIQTVYIKPPPTREIERVVRCADVSFNTSLATLRKLNAAATRQSKTHKVILMLEMGDLREGILPEKLANFVGKVLELSQLQVVGIGTNLNCLNGVMPSVDKMQQLPLYREILELRFGIQLPWITAGTTVTFPMLLQGRLPQGINHFRIGEALFFGKNLETGGQLPGLHADVFELKAELLEVRRKPIAPSGELGENPYGETREVNPEDYGKTRLQALLDVGTLDVDPAYLHVMDEDIEMLGASSDILAVDLGENKKGYKVGDYVRFTMDYMGALHLLNSAYVSKTIRTEVTELVPDIQSVS